MNKEKPLFSEKELSDLALETYKKNLNILQEKEKFISQLPYNDDYPRLFGNKWSICQSMVQKSLLYVPFMAFILLRPWTQTKYKSFSHLRNYKTYPIVFAFVYFNKIIFNDFLYPACQAVNRGDMGISTLEEETFKFLIEKCDIYDHIDAILDLKDKYSLYELEQLQKEWKIKKMNIIVDNMEQIRGKIYNK